MPDKRIIGRTQRRSDQRMKRSMPGSLVHVFLEAGKALKITQTADGVFISFDRSIVEEYRFGEKREINVGPVTADRVSGCNSTDTHRDIRGIAKPRLPHIWSRN